MSSRHAHDDLESPAQMSADCEALLGRITAPAPSIRYEDFPREVGKRGIDVSDAAARLAAALHLHLD